MTQQYTTDGHPYPPAPPSPEKPKEGLSKGVWAAITGGAVALVAIIVLVLVLAFGGDGDKNSDPAPAPAPVTVTASPEAPSPSPTRSAPAESKASSPQILSDAQFVGYILEERPVLAASMTDSAIVDLAKDSCERFDAGDTAMDVIYDSVAGLPSDAGEEAEAIGFVIGAGVQNYCDQHLERLTAELDRMNA